MYPVTTVLPSPIVVNSVMKLKPELSATAVHHSEFDGTEVVLVDGTEIALDDGTEVVVVDGTKDVPGEVLVTGVKVDGVFDLLGRNILIFF